MQINFCLKSVEKLSEINIEKRKQKALIECEFGRCNFMVGDLAWRSNEKTLH